MEAKQIEIITAANITYSGATYNTKLFVEYKHTGIMYYVKNGNKGKKCTSDKEIADKWISQNKKVQATTGSYFIDRIAIPTINANGEKDKWYITNDGDNYKVNKVSKYWKKIHQQLTQEQPLLN